MMKIILFFIILMISVTAFSKVSEDIKSNFKEKNFAAIVGIYDNNKKSAAFQKAPKLMVMTAYALEKQGRFKDAASLNMRLVKIKFFKEHQFINREIKNDSSIDSDNYPKVLLVLYWNIFKNLSRQILLATERTPVVEDELRQFNFVRVILENLEFRERQVDKTNDEVLAHLKSLEDGKYRLNTRLFVNYLSWQRKVDLLIAGNTSPIVITNKGLCAGGALGIQNASYSFFLDGCALLASGEIQSQNTSPTYQQSAIPVRGFMGGIGVGKIVSPTGAEIGFKIPIMMASQKLTQPPTSSPSCAAGCNIEEPPTMSIMGSLYSRWHFSNVYFQTELSKFIDQDAVLWSLGTGYRF